MVWFGWAWFGLVWLPLTTIKFGLILYCFVSDTGQRVQFITNKKYKLPGTEPSRWWVKPGNSMGPKQ